MSKENEWVNRQDLGDRRFLRNMDWNLLKVFTEIVRSDGLTSAAKAMSRQQPSISSALKRLEEYLDKSLCDRGPAGFSLTDHGYRLAGICNQIETLVASLQPEFDEIDNEITVQLRIVTVGNIVSSRLDNALARFGRRYPRAELLIKIAACPEIEAMVEQGEADIGVCPEPHIEPDLEYTFLTQERHVPVCGPHHHLFGTTQKLESDLVNEAFIIPGNDETEHIQEFREVHGWGNKVAGQSLDLNEVKRMLIAGLGIALLPLEFVQKDVTQGTLWPLMKPPVELHNDVFLVTKKSDARGAAARKFIEFLPEPEQNS
jgi:LysR family transcriptional regulator, transcriptional activator for bauABCD operon